MKGVAPIYLNFVKDAKRGLVNQKQQFPGPTTIGENRMDEILVWDPTYVETEYPKKTKNR